MFLTDIDAMPAHARVILSGAKNPGLSECWLVHPQPRRDRSECRIINAIRSYGAIGEHQKHRRIHGWGESARVQKDPGFFAALRMTQASARGLDLMKKKMLADREVQRAYAALDEEFELARELIAARVRAGFTQAQLARRMGTTQSAIARLESGAQLPSVKTLLRFAQATHSRPVIKLRAA